MTNKKIIVIGDSFATRITVDKILPEYQSFWVDVIKDNFIDYEVIADGFGGRDMQTIIDNWTMVLSNLTEEDYLIIGLTAFGRSRFPLAEKEYFEIKSKDETVKYTNRFIGIPWFYNKPLELWETTLYDQQKLIDTELMYQHIIDSSLAAKRNIIDIMKSLLKLGKCKTYIFSWDTIDIPNNFIEDKKILIENLNFWETIDDIYNKTNGVCGKKDDHHWSHNMNKVFGEYIVNKLKTL